ncbi:tRNA-specific adenosine deaminase 1 isoform X1 [Alosa sapidissima]|uniref:tRNA-specific adenosine deaminase 1 isoform X1 n=1 Tax=Alosa sapidissima TaxID=34773 RepID=UPI001C094FBF|nr:tRNA-specific adenosine deaminase 1 isoform X1 [Alosa sapidissima]
MWPVDKIARLCYDHFRNLPKRGKPELGREWTLLAAVVEVRDNPNGEKIELKVVSLGTGTKCIGRAAMSPKGDVLNDSHAEIIARRGCVRYLMEQLRLAVLGESSALFCPAEEMGKWKVHPEVSFVFFTSHTPCGDASIIPMMESPSQPCPMVRLEDDEGEGSDTPETALKRRAEWQEDQANKRHRTDQETHQVVGKPGEEMRTCSPPPPETADPAGDPSKASETPETRAQEGDIAKAHQATDVHRTGAKSVPGEACDPKVPGVRYHNIGVLRVKPGRGEPTLSLSCSDKMARWAVLGFQGALLSHYLQEAIYFKAVITGKCPYSQHAMQRALCNRCAQVTDLPAGFSMHPPEFLQSSLEFSHSQAQTQHSHQSNKGRVSPCGAAISWCAVPNQPLDVTANGYKQGMTKKAVGTPQARSLISKVELFHIFQTVVTATSNVLLPSSLRERELQTYWDYKQAAGAYQQAWLQLRTQVFPLWPRSPRELLQFH